MANRRAMSEQQMEALAAAAMRLVDERETKQVIAQAASDPHVFSEQHDAAVYAALADYRKRQQSKRRGAAVRRIAALIVVFVGISGVLLLNMEASRGFIINMVRQAGQQFEQIVFPKQELEYGPSSGDAAHLQADLEYYPSYIPNGFVLTNEYEKNGLIYRHEQLGKLVISFHDTEGYSLFVDNEDMQIEEISVSDQPAVIYLDPEGEKYNNLIWHKGEVVFVISGLLTKEELIRIAEGVRNNAS